MVAELVVVNWGMVFDAETAQLIEAVGTTVAAAIGPHEESGGSRHDSGGKRGARYLTGCERVKDFDGQNWMEWNSRSRVPLGDEDGTGGKRGRDGGDRHAGSHVALAVT